MAVAAITFTYVSDVWTGPAAAWTLEVVRHVCHYAPVIKGKLRGKDGTRFLFLGLSGENVTRLMADEPIWIQRTDLETLGFGIGGIDGIVIVGGNTEADILASMEQHVAVELFPPGGRG